MKIIYFKIHNGNILTVIFAEKDGTYTGYCNTLSESEITDFNLGMSIDDYITDYETDGESLSGNLEDVIDYIIEYVKENTK